MSILTPILLAATSLHITVWPNGQGHAVATGRFRGAPVRARFGREDGCEIARWNLVGFLFPAA